MNTFKTIILTSLVLSIGSSAFATDSNDLQRMRPSYHKIYDACAANPSDFKNDMYYSAYIEGMKTIVSASLFSTSALSDLKYYHGLSAFVGQFIEGETTHLALSDCMGPKEESKFVRNLLISEATGKFVGVAIAAVGYKGLGMATKKIGATLSFIPVAMKRKMLIAATVTGSALSLKGLYKEYKEIDGGKAVPEGTQAPTADFSKDFKQKTQTAADDNIAQLSKLLEDPTLSNEERAQIQNQINNWNIIKTKLS